MALKLIKRDLLHCDTRAQFNTKYLSADANNQTYTVGYGGVVRNVSSFTGEGMMVPWATPVFISDTHEIWLRGDIWKCGSVDAWGIQTADGKSVQETLEALATKVDNVSASVSGIEMSVKDEVLMFGTNT